MPVWRRCGTLQHTMQEMKAWHVLSQPCPQTATWRGAASPRPCPPQNALPPGTGLMLTIETSRLQPPQVQDRSAHHPAPEDPEEAENKRHGHTFTAV